jgi:hypothetical protein
MPVVLPKLWRQQPPYIAEIDWGNPLTQGLVFLLQDNRNAVSQIALTGTASQIVSKYGKTLSLNGSSDGLSQPVSGVDTSKGFSAHVLVNPANNTLTNTFIGLGTGVTDRYVALDLSGTEAPDPVRVISNGGTFAGTSYNNNAPLNQWTSYTAVWNTGANNQLYKNGQLATPSNTFGGTGATYPTVTSFDVGQITQTVIGNRLNGQIAFAAIWRRRLSSQEAAQLAVNPWQLFAPQKRYFLAPIAGGAVTHATTGALTGQGSSIVGSASRTAAVVTHDTTGILIGPGSVISGSAARTGAVLTHDTTGVLTGPGALLTGTANHISLYPDPSDVREGVQYGPGGIYTGTLTGGGGSTIIRLRSFTERH